MGVVSVWTKRVHSASWTYGYRYEESDGDAGRYCYGCLAVVFACEEGWVLEGSVCAHQRELSSSEDGIGFEGGTLDEGVRIGETHSVNLSCNSCKRARCCRDLRKVVETSILKCET